MTVPWDDLDAAIVTRIRALHSAVDPPPASLDERVKFALALQRFDLEVCRLQDDVLVGSGARASERSRTITFDSASLTIMVSIAETSAGLVRLDGWLAPAQAVSVELRIASPKDSRRVFADESGRFVFDDVPHGLIQLIAHPNDDNPTQLSTSVVTASMMV